MSIIKNRLSRNFTTLPNAIITEKISSNAFRMYCYLISKPDGWIVINNDVQIQLNIKDKNTIAKYWKELVTTGWVTRQKVIDDGGKFSGGYNYQLNEIAIFPNEENSLIREKPYSGKNHNTLLITNISIKKEEVINIYLLWEKLQNKEYPKNTAVYKARLETINRALKKYDEETINNVIEYKLTSQYTKNKELSSILGNFLASNIEKMNTWLANNKVHINYEEFKHNNYNQKINREPDKSTNLKAWLKWKYKDNDEDKKWWWWENLRGDNIRIQGRFIKERYEEACDYLGKDYCDKYVEAYDKGHRSMLKDGTSI